MVGNHKPEINDTSHGMWRRVGLVPFEQTIPKPERDPQLLEKLKAEGAGILNWMLDGLRASQKNGLQTPKKVIAATAGYRDEQDIIGEWIGEHCKTGAGYSEAKGKLYDDYKGWAKQNGHGVFAQTRLTRRLSERGYPLTKDKRHRADSGFPIFALEHGLADKELDEISSVLRSRLKARLSLTPHWLLWVIYATERGYSYAGDEYWRSFEEQTPEWEFGDRYKIVPWFRKFQQAYHGVEPSGPWTGHFRIIAWPITHAILPRYLQREFARALYDLRFRLAAFATLDPRAVGRLLAANAYHASTRFQEFLQQEELAGRIVLALLRAEPSKGKEPIDLLHNLLLTTV
jgi:hypothetical protein